MRTNQESINGKTLVDAPGLGRRLGHRLRPSHLERQVRLTTGVHGALNESNHTRRGCSGGWGVTSEIVLSSVPITQRAGAAPTHGAGGSIIGSGGNAEDVPPSLDAVGLLLLLVPS